MTKTTSNFPFLFSAPIAGFTNSILRELFHKGQADFIFSEMYNVNEIINIPLEKLDIQNSEYKLIIQLFGSFNDNFLKAIDKIKKIPYGIDINAGCPVKKVIKAKAGSYLLDYPEKIYKLLNKINSTFNIKLSIKMRLGFDRINILETVEAATKAKVNFISIHFRTRNQFFSGSIDWDKFFPLYNDIIKINNKIVVNGDINTPQKAFYLINKYSPFGIMIGRKALNDPFIFKKIKDYYTFKNLSNYNKQKFIKSNYYNLFMINDFSPEIDFYLYNYKKHFYLFNKYFQSLDFNILKHNFLKEILYIQKIGILITIYKKLKSDILHNESKILNQSENLNKKQNPTNNKDKSKYLKIIEFRKISHYLLKGLPDSNKIKNFINKTNNIDEIICYLKKMVKLFHL